VTNGADGTTPTIGDNGNWYLGDTDTGKPSRGEKGDAGEAGPAGEGVPAGGTAGQVLSKINGTDYNTEWTTIPTPDMSNYYTKSETNEYVTNNSTKLTLYQPSGQSFDLLGFKKGVYMLGFFTTKVYYSPTMDIGNALTLDTADGIIKITQDVTNDLAVGTTIGYVTTFNGSQYKINKIKIANGNSGLTLDGNYSYYQYVVTAGSQTITGTKKFSAIPQVSNDSVVPTDDKQFTTKKYVDDITGALVDLDTTDKTSLVNAINEIAAGSGGGSSDAVKVLFLDNYSSSSNALDMSKFETGIYIILRKNSGNTLYMKPRAGASTTGLQNATGANYLTMLIYNNQLPETYDYTSRSFTIYQLNPNYYTYWTYTDTGTDFSRNWSTAVEGVDLTSNQTISGLKTFNTLPVSSTTPTANNQLVNKQYVDTAISNAITSALGGSY
jgi:hypothetical protein